MAKGDRTPWGRRRKASPSVVPEPTVPTEPDRPEGDIPPPVPVEPDPATITPEKEKTENG